MKKFSIFLAAVLIAVFSFFSNSYSGPRNVLVEFCTGTWCGYCPCGDAALVTLQHQFPRTLAIAYHGASTDPWQTFNGFEVRSLLGFSAYPTAIIDRGNTPSNPYVTYEQWYGMVETRYNSSPNSNVDITVTSKSYDESSRALNLTINSTPLSTLTGQYKISVVLVEDNVVYPQNYYAVCGTAGYHNDYIHHDIARNMINGPTGEDLNTEATWNANEVITKNISTTVDASWSPMNCRVIVFVYLDNAVLALGNVEQAISEGIVTTGIGNENETPVSYLLSQNYPNPFNPVTHIKFSLPNDGKVSFKIYDIFGKEVDSYIDGFMNKGSYNVEFNASNLSSGVYFYVLKTDNFTDKKKMILVK
ncbi:MAG: Omp28-related outer membrane protein [Ignavibacteria bacterium]